MSKGYYEQSCEDFALFSNQWEEHCQDSGDDYMSEAYAGEVDQFAWYEDEPVDQEVVK